MKRIQYVFVLALLAALVNLPLLHGTWTRQKVERSGVDVHATVVGHEDVGGQHFVSFTFPETIDPDGRTWRADVDRTSYDAAVAAGRIGVRVLADDPSAYEADGQVSSHTVLVVTLVADGVLLVIVLLMLRFGWRARPQLRAIAVEDFERGPPGDDVIERLAAETYLIRGEVTGLEPGQVVLDVAGRSVLVYLDGHRNTIGYQQPAQVRARLL